MTSSIYLNRGDFDLAIKDFKECIRLTQPNEPNVALAYDNWGRVLGIQRNPTEAIPLFQKATEINPQYAPAFSHLGYAYLDLRDYSQVVEAFAEATRLNPNDEEAAKGLVFANIKINGAAK